MEPTMLLAYYHYVRFGGVGHLDFEALKLRKLGYPE